MQTLSKIKIIIPYFGKWPFWIEYFLASCARNKTIDWSIYTDCGLIKNHPQNVNIINMSFIEYCALVSKQLAINFKPTNPYKLCDIKPALGLVHADELTSYDFWAFGDLDLVYGDLRQYYDEERLRKKDVFSTHNTRISGHLCLIRNTSDLNAAFKKIKNWKEKFTQAEHIAFDEKDFSRIFLRHKNSPVWIKKIARWFDPWLERAEFLEAYTTPNGRIKWLDGTYNFPDYWLWREGSLHNNVTGLRQFPYFHFLIWKKNWNSTKRENFCDDNHLQIKEFTINRQGFKVIAYYLKPESPAL